MAKAHHPDALNVVGAPNFFGLKKQIGRAGWRVRRRSEGRTTESREAYLARRLFFHLGEKRLLKYPLSIEHGDAPDFIVSEARREYALEVTEACVEEDGREMALAEGSDEEPIEMPTLFGSLGGRGRNGFIGHEAERLVIDDISRAIKRKSMKAYVDDRPTDLLIYPNSNPAFHMHHAWQRSLIENAEYYRGSLRRIFIFWNDSCINAI